ncbi:MAG: hypothetical protein Q9M24_06930, partial [Mariprofundaceae bacterium]|nr:hypothetical protein [Mariprofundaceae bacterium]
MEVRHRSRISTPAIDAQDEYHALIATWMLRMMLGSAVAFRGFFGKRGFVNSDVSDFLQLQDVDDDNIKIKELKGIMRTLLNRFEHHVSASSPLFANISLLAKRVSLTPLQQQVLAFAVLKTRYDPLDTFQQNMLKPTETHLCTALGL